MALKPADQEIVFDYLDELTERMEKAVSRLERHLPHEPPDQEEPPA